MVQPRRGNRNRIFGGGLAQRRATSRVSVGVEVYHGTPRTRGGGSETHANLGLVIDFTAAHHLLMSAGPDSQGDASFQGYVAYQLIFGPD